MIIWVKNIQIKNEIYLIYFVVLLIITTKEADRIFRQWMRKDGEKAWLVANNWPGPFVLTCHPSRGDTQKSFLIRFFCWAVCVFRFFWRRSWSSAVETSVSILFFFFFSNKFTQQQRKKEKQNKYDAISNTLFFLSCRWGNKSKMQTKFLPREESSFFSLS